MRSLFARLPIATRITGAFTALIAAWAVVGNGVLVRFFANPEQRGLRAALLVALLALLLHVAIRRLVARFEAADAALRLSEERWNHALDGGGDGVWDWDGQTRKIFFSPRWKAMLGYEDHEIGDTLDEIETRVHPEDLDRMLAAMRRNLSGESEGFHCEHRLRKKDGSYVWVEVFGRVITRAADGRPLRAVGTQKDITDRRLAEARLRDAHNFNEAVLRAVPVGILTYRADGHVASANPAALRFVGADHVTVMAQNFRKMESWSKFGLTAMAEEALAKNTVVTRRGRYVTTFGRENWSDMTFAPFDYDGERRLLLIVQDTTDQHKATDQLELLRAALQAAPTGWVVTDAQGLIEWVNPGFTKLTGYPLEEAVGRPPSLLKSGKHPPAFYANLWQTVRRGEIWEGELCNRRKDGSLYYERMTIAPVRDAAGAIAHYVAMKEDITGQHDLEQQLNRSQRLESIGLIASGIAHDLNNMLAPIMLSVGMIGTRHKDRETRELLDMMQAAAQRGASVVQQVLTFARGVDGERTELDVRPLLKELAQLARETFPREIRVVVDVPAKPLLAVGDVTQLHQVLLNLAVNARDAMPDGGVLRLRAEGVTLDESAARLAPGGKAGDYVKLRVADTGSGIPPEIVERIFEPFFTTKPRGKGTGLGLSTVYGIVRSHGGFVTVTSQVGEGTEFSVLLPRSAVASAPAIPPAAAPAAIAGNGRAVLIVDDEDGVRYATGEVLKRHGFVVEKCSDGFEALRRLRGNPEQFSVAIVDLMMPGMSGYKLIPEMRRLAPDLAIIVASGMTGDSAAGETRAALTACGVRVLLDKPFAEAALLAALESELAAAV
jgi:PAS domain S-box-containing protein